MSSSKEFRSRVARRERLIGIFVKTIDHSVIEILGHRTGVDFVVLDLEHASASPERIDSCILAARAASLPLLVRVPSATSEYVAHTLDMGASGILFPRISTHVEAAQCCGQNAVSRRRAWIFAFSQSWLFWAIESTAIR